MRAADAEEEGSKERGRRLSLAVFSLGRLSFSGVSLSPSLSLSSEALIMALDTGTDGSERASAFLSSRERERERAARKRREKRERENAFSSEREVQLIFQKTAEKNKRRRQNIRRSLASFSLSFFSLAFLYTLRFPVFEFPHEASALVSGNT